MRLFEHIGCRSGQCIWEQLGKAILFVRALSNPRNNLAQRNKVEELTQEAGRLQDEQETHQEKVT